MDPHLRFTRTKSAKIADLIKKYADELKSEVMADNIMPGEMAGYTKEWNINGEDVVFGVSEGDKIKIRRSHGSFYDRISINKGPVYSAGQWGFAECRGIIMKEGLR